MKAKNLAATIFFAAVILGAVKLWNRRQSELVRTYGGIEMPDVSSKAPPKKSPENLHWELVSLANAKAAAFITNHVVGHRRIIILSCNTTDNEISNWTGLAEAEYINKLGGAERRFIYFRFQPSQARAGEFFPILGCSKPGNW